MDGAEEFSPNLPHSLRPFHFTLVLLIVVLIALIKKGQSRTTPYRSVIQLIILDTCTYLLLLFSSILFLISVLYSPRDEISASLLAPLFLLLGILVYVKKTQPVRRHLYALWIAAEAMCFVHDVDDDILALQPVGNLILRDLDRSAVSVVSTRAEGGNAPIVMLSKEPILTALLCVQSLHPWNHTCPFVPLQIPSSLIFTNFQNSKQQHRQNNSKQSQQIRLIIPWTTTCRFNPHRRFGSLWHRVTRQTCISRDVHGWWFIGCEIIQSLKHSLGLTFISDNKLYNDVSAMWKWAASQDLSFRKRLQISPVAEELARENGCDVEIVTTFAKALAGEGRPGIVIPEGLERQIAVEANLVAVLGMVVQRVYCKLRIEQLWQRLMIVFQDDTWLGEGLAIISVQSWRQRQISEIVIRWIVDASDVLFEA